MKRIVYVDMDGVLCDFENAVDRARKTDPDELYPHSAAGFYRSLMPLPGALEAMDRMLSSPDLDLYILTAPSVYNPLCYTEKRLWVEDHLGFEMTKRLIISPDKSLLNGDVLIDDNVNGHGQDRFGGTLVQFGSEVYPNWKSILTSLLGNAC